MKILLITSEITYVPENYNTVINGLSGFAELSGLVVIHNRSWAMLKNALRSWRQKTAPALAWQIVKNFFTPTNWQRRRLYTKLGKKIWFLKTLNSPEMLALLQREQVDLLVFLRTQEHPQRSILEASRLGGVKLHHGLFPEQRGVMCDFWAHTEQTNTGITLHEVTSRIDDGDVIRRVEVPRSQTSYLEYLQRVSILELALLHHFIAELRTTGTWKGADSRLSIPFRHHRVPTEIDFIALQKKGIEI